MEPQISTKVASNVNDGKSPVTTNGKTLRRQSLTGIQGPDRNRRSSLGEKTSESSKYYQVFNCIHVLNPFSYAFAYCVWLIIQMQRTLEMPRHLLLCANQQS